MSPRYKKKILRKIYRVTQWHYFKLDNASEKYTAKELRIINRSMIATKRGGLIDKMLINRTQQQ